MEMYICAELTWCYPRFDFHNNILAALLWYDTSFIHAWHRATHRFILRALTTLENLNFDCLQRGHTCIPFKVGWMFFFFCIVYWFLSRYLLYPSHGNFIAFHKSSINLYRFSGRFPFTSLSEGLVICLKGCFFFYLANSFIIYNNKRLFLVIKLNDATVVWCFLIRWSGKFKMWPLLLYIYFFSSQYSFMVLGNCFSVSNNSL